MEHLGDSLNAHDLAFDDEHLDAITSDWELIRAALEQPAAQSSERAKGWASETLAPEDRFTVSCWFVECRVNGNFDGWYAAPPDGEGGWLTEDPNKAHKYTEAEARAVAQALHYFHCPFRYSNWIATEHAFMGTAQ
jgi:hypothetical protein